MNQSAQALVLPAKAASTLRRPCEARRAEAIQLDRAGLLSRALPRAPVWIASLRSQ
jgi:hypothetical protein